MVLFALAALLALHDDPAAPAAQAHPSATVLLARHELPAGAVLRSGDVARRKVDAALVPAGAVKSGDPPLGRRVAVPVHRGEILTDVRFIAQSLTRAIGGPDAVAVPVRLADADAARLLRPGDHVDVFASGTDDRAAGARVLARDAVVILVPEPDQDAGLDGALVMLAVDANTARRLAGSAAGERLTASIRPG